MERLLSQLSDLEELKDDLTQEEYDEMKKDTLQGITEFEQFLEQNTMWWITKSTSGFCYNITIADTLYTPCNCTGWRFLGFLEPGLLSSSQRDHISAGMTWPTLGLVHAVYTVYTVHCLTHTVYYTVYYIHIPALTTRGWRSNSLDKAEMMDAGLEPCHESQFNPIQSNPVTA